MPLRPAAAPPPDIRRRGIPRIRPAGRMPRTRSPPETRLCATPPLYVRYNLSPLSIFRVMNARALLAASKYSALPATRWPRASADIIMPFHDASTLSSSPGGTRRPPGGQQRILASSYGAAGLALGHGAGERRRRQPEAPVQYGVALPVAAVGHPVVRAEYVRVLPQYVPDLPLGPDVVAALLALGVRVQGGIERPRPGTSCPAARTPASSPLRQYGTGRR